MLIHEFAVPRKTNKDKAKEFLADMAEYIKPEKLDPTVSCTDYKVLYAVAHAR